MATQRARINLSGGMASHVPAMGLPQGKSALVRNLLCDAYGASRSRPGLVSWPDRIVIAPVALQLGNGQASYTPQPVTTIGLYGFRKWLVQALSTRQVIVYNQDGTSRDITRGPGAIRLPGTDIATFLEDDDGRLVICAGGEPAVWKAGDTTKLERLGEGALPLASHAAICRARLCLNSIDDDLVYYSAAEDHTLFDTSGNPNVLEAGWFRAESRADPILAMVGRSELLYLFGSYSLDTYMPVADPTGPFSLAWSTPRGTAARRSVVFADNALHWLGDDRKLYKIAEGGQAPITLSFWVEDLLLNLGRVDDCIGQHVEIGGSHVIAWSFPTDGVTLVYDYALSQTLNEPHWYLWNLWEPSQGWRSMPLAHYGYVPDWNQRFCAGTEDSRIYQLDMSVARDGSAALVSERQSAPITHGTFAVKFSYLYRFMLQRGATSITDPTAEGYEPKLWVSFRDDGGAWQPEREVSLAGQGDGRYFGGELRRNGRYRSRELLIRYSSPTPLYLVAVEEDFATGSE
jgi:hypothetical protein